MADFNLLEKTITIRHMHPDDVENVVRVHLESFPEFFLTFLGSDFLNLLYSNIQNDHQGCIWVASRDGRIEGFLAAVIQQSGFYRRLLKHHKWEFALSAVRPFIKKPRIAPRLLKALQRPAEAQESVAEACLMSIAVRPESQGRKIGEKLFRSLYREFSELGIPALCLTTDRDGNDRVNQFYQKLGFELCRYFITPEGRVLNEYVLYLGKESHPEQAVSQGCMDACFYER